MKQNKRILLVFGTRPEAIKMCPLVKELKGIDGFDAKVCLTGQHKEMLYSVTKHFEVFADYDLGIMRSGQGLFEITERITKGMRSLLMDLSPDIVLVHGDTTTAFATALACFYLKIPVGHVEAGLRTYDAQSPYPEEFNRRAISVIAKYHFAPTYRAKENLLSEGIKESSVFITGNTGIDALFTTVRDDYRSDLLDELSGKRVILITAHRRENLGEPMRNMFKAIKRVISEHPDTAAVYPIHLNPEVRRIADDILKDEERIRIIEPLDVFDFHNLMARSYLILTDSGGIQEEAPSLGVPVIVMRETTERPEGISAGTLKLAGVSEDGIYDSFTRLLNSDEEYSKMAKAQNPYGDGNASRRIADILKREFTD